MDEPRIQSFEQFWPHYIKAHRNPRNRALHDAGTTCALGCVVAGVVTSNPLWFVAAPLVGYAPAWIGHFWVEHNRPATFDDARYSLIGDFKLLGLALRGKVGAEVARVCGVAEAAAASDRAA
jgi:hypothetical protein